MTVKELLDVYYHGRFSIYYFDGSRFIDLYESCDLSEVLPEEVLGLKVRAFIPSEIFHGISIDVEKPSWV